MKMNILNFTPPEIKKIDDWFTAAFTQTPPPPYCSVDVRNAGFKLAPVDTNLFPAGFNNLHSNNISHGITAAKNLAIHYVPHCKCIVIIPENHTRNIFYFESLAVLQSIFHQAGFQVRIGSLLQEIAQPTPIHLPSGKTLLLEPLKRENNLIILEAYGELKKFIPCMILLNHDLSEGIPEILKDISQKIAPPLALGWWSRKKSKHFAYYQKVAELFSEAFNLDPWLINAYFDAGQNINFTTRENEEDLIQKVDNLLLKISQKYQQYNIKNKPYVVIKPDSGTYGMGILMVTDSKQIAALNHKERSRLSSTKGNQKVSEVILQEGVYTIDKSDADKNTAESVIYMIETNIIGGFYRIHKNKNNDENLNAPGMTFEPLDLFKCPYFDQYKIVARLALLAAALELHGVDI